MCVPGDWLCWFWSSVLFLYQKTNFKGSLFKTRADVGDGVHDGVLLQGYTTFLHSIHQFTMVSECV